jgi:hypothetical protein
MFPDTCTAIFRHPKPLRRFRPGSRLRKKVEWQPPRDVSELALYQLREAIRENKVSFPSQVPALVRQEPKYRDLQWRLVSLYFIRGWPLTDLSKRYGLSRGHVWRILAEWHRHAWSAGYLQAIPTLESQELLLSVGKGQADQGGATVAPTEEA